MKIRNFAIIAHVDHGKSTLADRFLEIAEVLRPGEHQEQFLDRNPISRERGITIKLAPVTFEWKGVKFNLIDTPGHVDFYYEVDRTLSCVEGVILLVDATKGIQAQTVSNAFKAIEKDLVIIPAINKIDLPNAEVEKVERQIQEFLGVDPSQISKISAKLGTGVEDLLNRIIKEIPEPKVMEKDFKALVFDSYYDFYKGVIGFIRVFAGEIKQGDKVVFLGTGAETKAQEVGIFTPDLKPKKSLKAGEIGYICTNLKEIRKVRVGDTVVLEKNKNTSPLPGYKKVKPMVYASVFPVEPEGFEDLKRAIERLYLTDSAIEYTQIYSKALGAGFRMGFLGGLHADVVRERLEREFELEIVLTPPQVDFQKKDGRFFEPFAKLTVVTPPEYLSKVLEVARKRRAKLISMDSKDYVIVEYEMPIADMVGSVGTGEKSFFEDLKSVSSGYASFDWEFLEYRETEADELKILLNNDEVKEFSIIVPREKAQQVARSYVERLRKLIPRQLFEVRIQAKYKGKIIASARIPPYRRDVTAPLYGGDRTRKDKLLKKQKEGKKRLKAIGKVRVPKEVFLKMFRGSS